MRKIIFANDNYYHIYNRGVDKREIFLDEKDFGRFILSMREFNVIEPIGSLYENDFRKRMLAEKGVKHPIGCLTPSNPMLLVRIICWCLNPNHYHFILQQLVKNGISEFMKRLSGGYTNYFNTRYKRSGSLFQGPFKAKYIKSDSYLAWLSGYVNGNPEIHKIAKAKSYKWSSYQDYLGLRNGTLCDKNIVINKFGNDVDEYEKFAGVVINDSRERKETVKEYLSELE